MHLTSPSTGPTTSTRCARLRSTLRSTAAAATVVGLGLGATGLGAAPAGASVAGPVAGTAKAKCNQAIDQRLFVLSISEQRIAQVKRLTAEQKAAQIAGIDAVQANLENVNRPAVNAAVGKAQLKAACQAVLQDNRVYAVVIPQLFASVRIDEFDNAFDRFDPKIAEAKAAGEDTTGVEALVTDSKGHVDAAAAIVSAITPDSFNADPTGTRAKFDEATGHLNAALGSLLRAIVAYRDLTA